MAKEDKNKKQQETSAPSGPVATSGIETVEDLEACYPQLVSKIKDETIEFIRNRTALQIKENMPKLYDRIVLEAQGKSGPNLNMPGFLLEIDDPVAEGALRAYQGLKGISGLHLPYVLPYRDKETKIALNNYILRARGCGDIVRAKAAEKAQEKCK